MTPDDNCRLTLEAIARYRGDNHDKAIPGDIVVGLLIDSRVLPLVHALNMVDQVETIASWAGHDPRTARGFYMTFAALLIWARQFARHINRNNRGSAEGCDP